MSGRNAQTSPGISGTHRQEGSPAWGNSCGSSYSLRPAPCPHPGPLTTHRSAHRLCTRLCPRTHVRNSLTHTVVVTQVVTGAWISTPAPRVALGSQFPHLSNGTKVLLPTTIVPARKWARAAPPAQVRSLDSNPDRRALCPSLTTFPGHQQLSCPSLCLSCGPAPTPGWLSPQQPQGAFQNDHQIMPCPCPGAPLCRGPRNLHGLAPWPC